MNTLSNLLEKTLEKSRNLEEENRLLKERVCELEDQIRRITNIGTTILSEPPEDESSISNIPVASRADETNEIEEKTKKEMHRIAKKDGFADSEREYVKSGLKTEAGKLDTVRDFKERPFISVQGNQVIIDGSSKDAKKRDIEGVKVVQLRTARNEECGFNWGVITTDHSIVKISVKDIIIYDSMDIKCLNWFIICCAGKVLDFSVSFVSPDAYHACVNLFESLAENGHKVCDCSKINVPFVGGLTGMGRTEMMRHYAEEVNFTVTYK